MLRLRPWNQHRGGHDKIHAPKLLVLRDVLRGNASRAPRKSVVVSYLLLISELMLGMSVKKSAVAADPQLPELLLRAHTEAIKRFYEDKDFAVKSYLVYDKQPPADVARFYDVYVKGNLFERIPYLLAHALSSVLDQQTDPQMIALFKGYDFRKVIDNSYVDRMAKEGYFEKVFGPGIKAEQERKAKLAFR